MLEGHDRVFMIRVWSYFRVPDAYVGVIVGHNLVFNEALHPQEGFQQAKILLRLSHEGNRYQERYSIL